MLSRGVITASAGNHAQGVALAAQKLGCRAVIVMPVTTPRIKVEAAPLGAVIAALPAGPTSGFTVSSSRNGRAP